MMTFNKSILALALGSALVLGGCSDGEDGAPGAPGEPGAPGDPGAPYVPVVETSEVTNFNYISHAIEDGQVIVEFEATNAEDVLINGLEMASVYVAEKTELGVQRHPDGSVGGTASIGGDSATDGSSMTQLDDGRYQLVAAIASINAGTDALIRVQVGGSDAIAASQYTIIQKPADIHTTTTETCYACHVDYATSDIKHSKYVAYDLEGNADFVAGCMLCHNNVAGIRDEDNNKVGPGYASNTMQKLGHVNHQKFEMDFTPTNCYTCHAAPVMNTDITGNGCTDCHSSGSAAMVMAATVDEFDVRALHADAAAISERADLRAKYSTTASSPYFDASYAYDDGAGYAGTGGYCIDIKLYDNSGDAPAQVNIKEMYDAGELAYTSVYIDGYDVESDSIVARVISRYDSGYGYYDREDGTRSVCYTYLDFAGDFSYTHLAGSSRLTIKDSAWQDSDNEYGVSFTSFSDPVEVSIVDADTYTLSASDELFERRHTIDYNACTTCHNNGTNYHKSGSYTDGGRDCSACHNNGYDRNAAGSAPGFGPMIHSMHWGDGNDNSGNKTDEGGNKLVNSAASLNADNCVSCHSAGIDLYAVPNRYMLSKSLNGGTSGVMTTPLTANCAACHASDSAIAHMTTNGGEMNVTKSGGWFTTSTSESCATCHATGKTFGIDKYHNLER